MDAVEFKVFVFLLVAALVVASAILAVTTAWAVLRAVDVHPLRMSLDHVRWILAAGAHFDDPRVSPSLRVRRIAANFLGGAGFSIAAVGLALDGSPGGAIVFGALGLFSVASVVVALRRHARAASRR